MLINILILRAAMHIYEILNEKRLKPGKIQKIKAKKGPFEEKYAPLLLRDCKQIIRAYKKANHDFKGVRSLSHAKCLFRGTNRKPEAYIGMPRVDRNPKDTSKLMHNQINMLLTRAGFEATRANSIFVSSNIGQVEDYGTAYIIFPLDGFKFTWSSKYGDLFSEALESLDNIAALSKPLEKSYYIFREKASNKLDKIANLLDDLTSYTSENFRLYKHTSEKGEYGESDTRIYDAIFQFLDLYGDRMSSFAEELDDLDEHGKAGVRIILDFTKKELMNLAKFKRIIQTAQKLKDKKLEIKVKNLMQHLSDLASLIKSNIDYVKRYFASDSVSKQDIKSIIDHLQLSKTDLDAALRSKNEIYLSGKYYAFELEAEWEDRYGEIYYQETEILKWLKGL